MHPWLEAFILTQLVEVPLYCWLLSSGALWRRALVGFIATTITHPIIWFVLHAMATSWNLSHEIYLLMAESYAVGVEGLFLWALSYAKPWRLALLINMASFALGLIFL